MTKLNMEGKPCPMPVIAAKKELALPHSQGVALLVDNQAAVQNLAKMARGFGCTFSESMEGDLFCVTILKEGVVVIPEVSTAAPAKSTAGATILIPSNQMGRGEEALGRLLLKGFLFSLTEQATPPERLIFLNSGVELVCQGSTAIGDLETLVAKGTDIVVCGTCLNFYQLTESLAVGKIVDMYQIAGHLTASGNVITL